MRNSLTASLPATPRETLAGISGKAVKASLRPQVPATPLRDLAADALRTVTSQKAAAVDLDLSEGRLSHKLQDGTLTLAQLEELGPSYGAELGRRLTEHYAPLVTPHARIREQIRTARRALDEIEQFTELVS